MLWNKSSFIWWQERQETGKDRCVIRKEFWLYPEGKKLLKVSKQDFDKRLLGGKASEVGTLEGSLYTPVKALCHRPGETEVARTKAVGP